MNDMTYEYFIRSAFSIKLDNMIDRSGDMAGLADADVFRAAVGGNIEYLNKVKIGTGYAMAIFNNEIFNNNSVTEADESAMEDLFNAVILANSADDVATIITNYKGYRDKYLKFNWK